MADVLMYHWYQAAPTLLYSTHTVDGLNVRCGGREAFSARLPMQGATNVSDQRRRSRPTDSADGLTGLRHR